tara:strand:- start:7 stop:132 length:126 start_codon:yes stop_codon:yes gene_type:complete
LTSEATALAEKVLLGLIGEASFAFKATLLKPALELGPSSLA